MHRTKTIRAETKVLDSRGGLVEAVVSDESKDRDGDIIRVSGWDMSDFEKHPVLVASHNYFDLRSQIGEWEEMAVKGKRLVGVARYMVGQGNEQADWGYNLASRGRAAFSVGFAPEIEKAKELSGGGLEFTSQKLIEVSHVVVPANPNALQALKTLKQHQELDPVIAGIVDDILSDSSDDAEAESLVKRLWPYIEKRLRDLGTEGVPLVPDEYGTVSKGPIASHSTGTSDDSWDGPANEAKLSNDAPASTLRRAFAWVDPEGDADTKAAYKFIHHMVSESGSVGAANMRGCSAGIAVLNGGRGGADIPDSDRQGTYNHLKRHLRDGDREVPELRGIADSIFEEATAWLN